MYGPCSHHYQVSIDFNTVNIHRPVGMYFLIFTGSRGDIDIQYTPCPLGSVLGNTGPGTVFLDQSRLKCGVGSERNASHFLWLTARNTFFCDKRARERERATEIISDSL